jgi:hypothetical protein
MTDPAITPELVAKHNLTPDEFAQAKEILDRDGGQRVFAGVFAALKGKLVAQTA